MKIQLLDFQDCVLDFCLRCFGFRHTYDKLARGDRYIEEVFELLQALDYPRERIHQIEAYVYSRPPGDVRQEVGGVALTFNALCTAHHLPVYDLALVELQRVWENIEVIRKKQLEKEKDPRLPPVQNMS